MTIRQGHKTSLRDPGCVCVCVEQRFRCVSGSLAECSPRDDDCVTAMSWARILAG